MQLSGKVSSLCCTRSGSFCEGFRMPALRERATRTGPASENLQGRKPRETRAGGAARSADGNFGAPRELKLGDFERPPASNPSTT